MTTPGDANLMPVNIRRIPIKVPLGHNLNVARQFNLIAVSLCAISWHAKAVITATRYTGSKLNSMPGFGNGVAEKINVKASIAINISFISVLENKAVNFILQSYEASNTFLLDEDLSFTGG